MRVVIARLLGGLRREGRGKTWRRTSDRIVLLAGRLGASSAWPGEPAVGAGISNSVDCEASMSCVGAEDMSLDASRGGLRDNLRIVGDSKYDATNSGSTSSRGWAGSDLVPATPRERYI